MPGYVIAERQRDVSENGRRTAVCSRRVVVSVAVGIIADLYDVQRRFSSESVVLKCTSVSRLISYMGADKSLAQPGRKQATATEDFDVHISYLLS